MTNHSGAGKDRKTLIADAAIDVLAQEGIRGLTHRAVDQYAGLPTGSTSFYCRRRIDLLSLTLQRHAALDMADLAHDSASRLPDTPLSVDGLVDVLVQQLADWLSAAKRSRLLARFELFLAASREPELAQIVDRQRELFLAAAIHTLTMAGIARPEAMAPTLMVLTEGILLDQLRAHTPLLDVNQYKPVLRALLLAA